MNLEETNTVRVRTAHNSAELAANNADIATVFNAQTLKSRRKRRVVIIEDDPFNADHLTSLVGKLGHDVVVKGDSSASHTYEVRDDDIVFLDMLMPKVNGIQVLEQFGRQNVQSAIVLMSGNDRFLNEAEQLVKKLDLDLLGVLHKPFHLPDVRSVLETA